MSEIILKAPSFFAGFLQFDVQSGAIEKNLSRVREGLAEIAESHKQISPGIIVLPELWATGFAYAELPALVGTIPDVLETLQELSAKYQVSIAGSLPEYTDNKYYNTLFITGPTGTFGTYRKQRLFSPMAEDTFFSPGTDPNPIQTTVGPVAGLVCYDLRFPELLRQQTALGASLLDRTICATAGARGFEATVGATMGYDPEAITIRHLLTHTSGLFDHGGAEEYTEAILSDLMHPWTRTEQLRGAVEWGDPHGKPGEVYTYADTGYILLGEIVDARCNVVVSGATSSGKTSLAAALLGTVAPSERLVVVEDTTELPLRHPHTVRLEARPATIDGPPAIDLAQLVRTALRLRPDRIVVGEVRGDEVLALVQAMNTGHDGSISTCHANGPLDALLRHLAL